MSDSEPASKKVKVPRFLESWASNPEYKKWLVKSRKGSQYFHCNWCNSDGRAGTTEVQRHAQSSAHIKHGKSVVSQASIGEAFASVTSSSTIDRQVKVAEMAITSFIVEHNLAFNVAPHVSG